MGKALSRTVKCSKVRISVSKVSKVGGGEIFTVNVVNVVNLFLRSLRRSSLHGAAFEI
jgi:hypothetical protein